MLDSPHTSAPMLVRVNALVLKTPVENAPRTSILRNTCYGPQTSLLQRAFHSTYHVQQNISPTDNPPPSARRAGRERHEVESDDNEVGRTSNELSPPKSACTGDAVLRISTRGTVHMGQYTGL
jgi:hypothetical protein